MASTANPLSSSYNPTGFQNYMLNSLISESKNWIKGGPDYSSLSRFSEFSDRVQALLTSHPQNDKLAEKLDRKRVKALVLNFGHNNKIDGNIIQLIKTIVQNRLYFSYDIVCTMLSQAGDLRRNHKTSNPDEVKALNWAVNVLNKDQRRLAPQHYNPSLGGNVAPAIPASQSNRNSYPGFVEPVSTDINTKLRGNTARVPTIQTPAQYDPKLGSMAQPAQKP
ncbi:MAG: hypothetical protein JHC93_07435 [Parachlamydiales bacterium]|nr:hypothetical protein [Parachlamydiales bacterium]